MTSILLHVFKADSSIADEFGNTPLHTTIKFAHDDVPFGAYHACAHILIEEGADPLLENAAGESTNAILATRKTSEEDWEGRLAELSVICDKVAE